MIEQNDYTKKKISCINTKNSNNKERVFYIEEEF